MARKLSDIIMDDIKKQAEKDLRKKHPNQKIVFDRKSEDKLKRDLQKLDKALEAFPKKLTIKM